MKEYKAQRDAMQRERLRLQDQLQAVSTTAHTASEREQALYVRTTVLEQQLGSVLSGAVTIGDADGGVGGHYGTGEHGGGESRASELLQTMPSLQEALEGIGQVNRKYAMAGAPMPAA